MQVNKWLITIFTIVLVTLVAGCSTSAPPAGIKNSDVAEGVLVGAAAGAAVGALSSGASIPVTTAMGGIVGGAIGSAIEEGRGKHDSLMTKLSKDHVQVIRIGEDYMLVLPSDIYFYRNSTHLNEKLYPAYHDIVQFINQFEVETIKVAGYTDNIGDPVRNLALSRQQAQYVSNELWRDGVTPAMIYAIGYGSAHPIAVNNTPEGRKENRRVQITFRRLTPGS